MNIYDYSDYRAYLRERIQQLPKGGRGELLRISKAAGIHPSILSQVFQGQRELSEEQAVAVCDHFSLDDKETEYLLLLVRHERAGTARLKKIIARQIEEVRSAERQLIRRLPIEAVLSEEQKAVFYSNWYYSAARVLSSLPDCQTIERISHRLGLPRAQVSSAVAFLLEHGLCVQEGGRIAPGPQSTHIEAGSPLVARHHANWRIKAMERHPSLSQENELAYTSPVSIAQADVGKVREKLVRTIQDFCEVVDPSAPERTYCLNIDWFEFSLDLRAR